MTRTVLLLVACALLAVAYLVGRETAAPDRVLVPDTVHVTPPELAARIAALEIERDGLRARLAGVHRSGPRRVVVADTVYREIPAPRCVVVARADGAGRVTVGRYDRIAHDTASGWAPAIDERVDLGRCDDGWSIGPAGYTCNPARLGHLRLLLRGIAGTTGALGEIGLSWQPSYRSGARVSVTLGTDHAWRVSASLSPRLPVP